MAFDVYPGSPNPPIAVPAGGNVVTAFLQERRSAEAPPRMYIRVSSIDGIAPPPIISLQAGTGDFVQVPGPFIYDLPGGMAGAGQYVADCFRTAEAGGIYLITVILYVTGSTWHLKIENPGGVPRKFVFVVADSDINSKQSWIDVNTTLTSPPFEVLINYTGNFNVDIHNFGTGPLSIASGTLAGADAASYTFVPPVATILSNAFLTVPVTMLAVTTPKTISAALNLTSNDPTAPLTIAGHNSKVNIAGQVEEIELAFMLDASGSMAFDPAGASVFATHREKTRWGMLKSAAQATLTLLGNHAEGKGTFAVGMYPDITGFPPNPNSAYAGPFPVASPSSADFQNPMVSINPANIKVVAADEFAPTPGKLEAHFARENAAATPMGEGIRRAISYFSTNTANVRWLILMTDGNQNSGQDPSDFYAGAGSFVTNKIRTAMIGYGNDGAPLAPVNRPLLNAIASHGFLGVGTLPNPNFHYVNAVDDPSLTSTFVKSVVNLSPLPLFTITDPAGVLTTLNPTVTRQVSVTQYDLKLSFFVAWTTYDSERLRVQVRTPLGELIEAPGHGFTIDSNPRFRMLTFDNDFLSNAADPGQPRYGTWTLIVSLNTRVILSVADVAAVSLKVSEAYDYQVIVDSRLRLAAQLNQASFAPGDTIKVTALPTLDWRGIRNLAVTLSRSIPVTASINWLASSLVTSSEYERAAAEQRNNPDIDSLGIKQIALNNKGQKFTLAANSDVVNMVDSEGLGTYSAEIANTGVTGTYAFLMSAVGSLPDGTIFTREQSVNIELVVRPDPAFTFFHVDYSVFTQGSQTFTRAAMIVRPLDRFGNVVLIDPQFDPSLVFNATGGTFEGPIVDNHDGSYTRSLVYPPGVAPGVSVTVGGVTVVPPVPVADIGGLTFADKVLDFHLGREAVSGANLHRDPAACLGNFTTKPSPVFVALGGGGSIVLGYAGHFIAGQGGNDDITVFVSQNQQARPYSVEVTHEDEKKENGWIEIGRSPGVTQSFGLRQGSNKLNALAVRIRDLSGILRNIDGSASSGPGTCVVALGARHVEKGDDDLDDKLTGFVKKIFG